MKFENSIINQIYNPNGGSKIMLELLSNPALVKRNPTFWAKYFKIDNQPTPTDASGEAAFVAHLREISVGSLMDMRAPLAESLPMDKAGERTYTGTIPNWIAKGWHETATERYTREQTWQEMGEQDAIIRFAQDVLQIQLDSANQTLSHMAARLMSTGQIVYNGGDGIKGGVLKADIPTDNFMKAKGTAWNDPSAKIITQMQQLEEEYRTRTGFDGALVWDIPTQVFNAYFLTNAEVKEAYRYLLSVKGGNVPEITFLTREMGLEALSQMTGISTIQLVEEKQKDGASIVSGWENNKVVLRPAGLAGVIKYATTLDEKVFPKYGSKQITRNFTKTLGGLATFMNSVHDNGNFKEWHTDLLMCAVPVLNQFTHHAIISVNEAE